REEFAEVFGEWNGSKFLIKDGSVLAYVKGLYERLASVNENQLNIRASVQSFREEFGNLYDLVHRYWQNDLSIASNGFSDILSKLDSLSISVVPDMSGVESRLDYISQLLLLAGAKDILDTLIGDFNFSNAQAMAGSVQSAISNAFPFCIPAVLKQVLGLVQAEAVPPSFSFDFFGAPLEFDFEDWRGLADVTGWICRVFFTVGLLSQTRRFIFAGRDGVA
ncbi:MAG: hypothetical protein UCH28_06405, partial [Adlercreutzia sp.]|nr:hypothetical protein [Adlercreutzia sp.]